MKTIRTILRSFVLGALAGLLIAPRSGRETRDMIAERWNDFLDGASGITFDVPASSSTVDRVASTANKVVDSVRDNVAKAADVVADTADDVKAKTDDAADAAKDTVDDAASDVKSQA